MFTVDVLTRNTGLTPLQLRACFRQIGFSKQPTSTEELNSLVCWQFWIFLLIDKLKFLDPEQKSLLFEELSDALDKMAVSNAQPMLVIADSRYATWPGRNGWLDLSNGQSKDPTTPPLETLGYDLTVLRERNKLMCRRIKDEQSRRSPDR